MVDLVSTTLGSSGCCVLVGIIAAVMLCVALLFPRGEGNGSVTGTDNNSTTTTTTTTAMMVCPPAPKKPNLFAVYHMTPMTPPSAPVKSANLLKMPVRWTAPELRCELCYEDEEDMFYRPVNDYDQDRLLDAPSTLDLFPAVPDVQPLVYCGNDEDDEVLDDEKDESAIPLDADADADAEKMNGPPVPNKDGDSIVSLAGAVESDGEWEDHFGEPTGEKHGDGGAEESPGGRNIDGPTAEKRHVLWKDNLEAICIIPSWRELNKIEYIYCYGYEKPSTGDHQIETHVEPSRQASSQLVWLTASFGLPLLLVGCLTLSRLPSLTPPPPHVLIPGSLVVAFLVVAFETLQKTRRRRRLSYEFFLERVRYYFQLQVLVELVAKIELVDNDEMDHAETRVIANEEDVPPAVDEGDVFDPAIRSHFDSLVLPRISQEVRGVMGQVGNDSPRCGTSQDVQEDYESFTVEDFGDSDQASLVVGEDSNDTAGNDTAGTLTEDANHPTVRRRQRHKKTTRQQPLRRSARIAARQQQRDSFGSFIVDGRRRSARLRTL